MKTIVVVVVTGLGMMTFGGITLANLLEVKKAVEGTLCRKLATDYAKDPSALTVQSIAQLQICLAQTLQAAPLRAIPKNFDIQATPPPSSNRVDTILPTPPTPPTPPSSIKIP